VLHRTNVEALPHTTLAHERALGKGEGARVFGLARMRALLDALGNPHQHASPIVHVAGSKGKGTVCECIASALHAAGVRVGLFTSPHLLHVGERIRLDGVPASSDELEGLAMRALHADDARLAHDSAGLGPATTFELLFAMSQLHSADNNVRVRIIEVGLGGELDATNVVQGNAHSLCILTTIQLEHTQLLGSTLEQIAAHKAGILKAGVPALCLPQAPQVQRVFEAFARERGAPLLAMGRDVPFRIEPAGLSQRPGIARCTIEPMRLAGVSAYSIDAPLPQELSCFAPAPGEHVALNVAAALAACTMLAPHLALQAPAPANQPENQLANQPANWPANQPTNRPAMPRAAQHTQRFLTRCAQGIEACVLPGRLQRIAVRVNPSQTHTLIVDGAHTPESVSATLLALEQAGLVHASPSASHAPGLVTIFGCAQDKDARAMLLALQRVHSPVVLLALGPRATPTSTLLALAQSLTLHALVATSPAHALTLACELATTVPMNACSQQLSPQPLPNAATPAGIRPCFLAPILATGSFALAGDLARAATILNTSTPPSTSPSPIPSST
jgi:folylpolyglutamate synthase/dihydrofolate synthase